MAIGATGVGKSTLMNAIIQGPDAMFLNDDCNIEVKDLLKNQYGNTLYEIGYGMNSCT